jgi:HD-GYP domain-containing protein (c-di-GMP phosphodiesterase class II)/DNA-binding CsgD family transcriptional regulator
MGPPRMTPAARAQRIALAELLAAVTLATDLGRGFPPEKALRTCLVALRIGEALGLGERELRDVFYGGLVHAAGCTAFTSEAARRFGTSELTGIPAFAPVDPARPVESLRAIRASAQGEPPARRVRATLTNLGAGKRFRDYALQADCEAGAAFARRCGLGDRVATIVGHVHTRWDGKGVPRGLDGEAIEPAARLIALANQIEIFHRTAGRALTRAMVRRRAAGWFDPAAAATFGRCDARVFDELEAGSVWDAVLGAEPEPPASVPAARLDDLAAALAGFVDVKSPYLLGHSSGVAALAELAAAALGLGEPERTALRLAGLVHDLGRVAVSNRVWDKRGGLTASEWEQVRLHPYHGERILARSAALRPLAELAGMHHERCDGSGYHRGVTAAAMSPGARLLAAADAFQAMTEPRPHRPALAPERAADEVERMIRSGALDVEAASAVCEAAGVALRRGRASAPWPAELTGREVDVLRLLARGLSKKAIAATLVIAPGTVHTHTVHIYEKLGVSTRAGVALFAMEHGLVRP